MKVIVKVYNGSKYSAASQVIDRITYDIDNFSVMNKADFEDIEVNELDPHDEYLRLQLTNGNTATFRNSFVDMFRW